jgi:hypothetical protein
VQRVHQTIRVFRLNPQDVTLAEEDAVAMRKAARPLNEAAPVAVAPRMQAAPVSRPSPNKAPAAFPRIPKPTPAPARPAIGKVRDADDWDTF